MLRWLDVMLFKWADMSMRAADGGLGYGRSSLSRLVPIRSGYASGGSAWETSKTDILALDAAVQALPLDMRQAVVAYYQLDGGKKSPAARRIGVDRSTIIRRLSHAHVLIAQALEGGRPVIQPSAA